MWYEINQNNSGGSLKTDDKLCHRLFIEARTAEKAKEKGIQMGVYFDGVADGVDCDCCGDRWSSVDEVEIPNRYGTFDKEEAESIAEKYGADVGKTTWKFMGTEDSDPNKYDVVFRDVESYAQYLADRFSIEKGVDARVFYVDGKVSEITPKK